MRKRATRFLIKVDLVIKTYLSNVDMRWGDVGQFGAHSDVGGIGVVFTPVLGPALKFTGMQGHDDWGDPIAHLNRKLVIKLSVEEIVFEFHSMYLNKHSHTY